MNINLCLHSLQLFLQAIDIFLFIFKFFSLCVERGRRNLEESIHNENHWPQLLHVSGVKCQIDHFACFAAYFSTFLKENASWRKLMNYKPENRIPSLFTDFDNIKDLTWLFKKFPDVSLTVATLISERHRKFSGRRLLESVAYKPSLPPLIATTPSPIQL